MQNAITYNRKFWQHNILVVLTILLSQNLEVKIIIVLKIFALWHITKLGHVITEMTLKFYLIIVSIFNNLLFADGEVHIGEYSAR